MPNTISSIGAQLYHTSLATANLIGNVLDVTGPGFSRDTIDTTSHSSPDDFKEKMVTRWDAGDLTFDLQWDPEDANHQFLTDMITTSAAADDPKTYVLRVPSAPAQASWMTITFTAHLTNFGDSIPVEGVLQASVTLEITGAPTINTNDPATP